ncbi:helix-turn-helix domain-containing protein [Streptomyces massasporeus]|uniref:helix-turn-helix domain-containing protein n=1 Tax=Streptomyces massasporeus TaxID=67324 RepID=UPI001E4A60F6|nr:helix-turn-helix domain-containing protein [Streptomyces massasporeus]
MPDRRDQPEEASASGPSRYLREEDRIHIADRLREKASVLQIARELDHSPSTISRERRGNGMPLRGALPAGLTGRTPRTAAPSNAARAPSPARSDRTPGCGTSSCATSNCAGALSRSARLYGPPSPTGRRCTWSTRRSTRPSMPRAAARCAGS